jgi:hypothetical protein
MIFNRSFWGWGFNWFRRRDREVSFICASQRLYIIFKHVAWLRVACLRLGKGSSRASASDRLLTSLERTWNQYQSLSFSSSFILIVVGHSMMFSNWRCSKLQVKRLRTLGQEHYIDHPKWHLTRREESMLFRNKIPHAPSQYLELKS